MPPNATRKPEVIIGDITTLDTDAIVNAANEQLAPGGGVCGAIHRAAGPQLAEACRPLAPCPTGDARITPGFNLPARYVIHAVGPVYRDQDPAVAEQLASAYQRSLELAHEHQLQSIAFPCISTGIYGYPLTEATTIALNVLTRWLATGRQPQRIICCCFRESDAAEYRRQLHHIT